MRLGLAWTTVGLLLAAMALGAFPAQAGTEAAPEITDPADDQAVAEQVPVSEAGFTGADILKAWVDGETADSFLLHIVASGDIVGGTAQGNPTTYYRLTFNFKVGGTAYTAGADVHWEAVATPEGAASAAALDGAQLTLTVPKASVGNPAGGAAMTELFASTSVHLADDDTTLVADRAPNSGFGTDYGFTGSGGGGGSADDTDGDGLNDTWEQGHFGDLTENATGDPDGDGRTNAQEFASGTDPTNPDTDADGLDDGAEFEAGTNATNPDTDGDGFTDGEEVEAGSDPLDPESVPDKDGGGGDGDGDGDGGDGDGDDGSGDGDGTGGDGDGDGAGGDGDTDSDESGLDGYVESIKDDPGYAAASAAGMGAVLLLSIIGLAGRWGL